jgi:hypothetical protein
VGDFTKTDEPPVGTGVSVALCRSLRVLTDLICLTSAVDEESKMKWRKNDVGVSVSQDRSVMFLRNVDTYKPDYR